MGDENPIKSRMIPTTLALGGVLSEHRHKAKLNMSVNINDKQLRLPKILNRALSQLNDEVWCLIFIMFLHLSLVDNYTNKTSSSLKLNFFFRVFIFIFYTTLKLKIKRMTLDLNMYAGVNKIS